MEKPTTETPFRPHDGKLDAINNTKSVLISDQRPGKDRITVLAIEVLEGPQEFSLIYSGGFKHRE